MILCTGYYRYEEGYTPSFRGAARFGGQIVHPQQWSDAIDYDGKRVAVIGSGATAVTLVPALAERAAHVTMIQRSPTYVISFPGEDPIANALRRLLPAKLAYTIVRWKNVVMQTLIFQLSRHVPTVMKAMLRKQAESNLPAGYDIDMHFTPACDPWDQRMCLIPDADLFEAIGRGGASVVTDQIDTFTHTGIRLRSGREIEADLIVTATGLDLLALGGTQLSVDGVPVDIAKTVAYKGMMLCGVPNLAFTFGYTNASWTLKADLTSEYVCRLFSYMDDHGYRECSPLSPGSEARTKPFLDLSSGYVQRAMDRFPRQGARGPWRNYQNYARDILNIRYGCAPRTTSCASGARRRTTSSSRLRRRSRPDAAVRRQPGPGTRAALGYVGGRPTAVGGGCDGARVRLTRCYGAQPTNGRYREWWHWWAIATPCAMRVRSGC